jgi:hypothetical protein
MAAKLTMLTHKIAIQLHLVVESCNICSSRCRRPVRILLDTPSCVSNNDVPSILETKTNTTQLLRRHFPTVASLKLPNFSFKALHSVLRLYYCDMETWSCIKKQAEGTAYHAYHPSNVSVYMLRLPHLHLVPKSRMRGAIPPLPQYLSMAWCLVKHRNNLNFTLITNYKTVKSGSRNRSFNTGNNIASNWI